MGGMEKAAEPIPSHSNLVGMVAKKKLRKLLIREGTVRRRNDLALGNLYHAALYDLLQSSSPHEDKIVTINHIKAKIVRL